jgi:hypothetical protein
MHILNLFVTCPYPHSRDYFEKARVKSAVPIAKNFIDFKYIMRRKKAMTDVNVKKMKEKN